MPHDAISEHQYGRTEINGVSSAGVLSIVRGRKPLGHFAGTIPKTIEVTDIGLRTRLTIGDDQLR